MVSIRLPPCIVPDVWQSGSVRMAQCHQPVFSFFVAASQWWTGLCACAPRDLPCCLCSLDLMQLPFCVNPCVVCSSKKLTQVHYLGIPVFFVVSSCFQFFLVSFLNVLLFLYFCQFSSVSDSFGRFSRMTKSVCQVAGNSSAVLSFSLLAVHHYSKSDLR